MYFVNEILRTNIMILLTFYYVRMASVGLLSRKDYKSLKYTLICLYFLLMGFMLYCGFFIWYEQEYKTLQWN